MSSGMPELGSKISLISKADIRYEGELYTVDPIECTIALSNGKFWFWYHFNGVMGQLYVSIPSLEKYWWLPLNVEPFVQN